MAQRHDITIDQGSDFILEIELYDENGDLDETTYTAAGKIRQSFASNSAVAFTCNVANGTLTVKLDHVSSANVEPGRYLYDVELTDPSANIVTRIIEGTATITPEITK